MKRTPLRRKTPLRSKRPTPLRAKRSKAGVHILPDVPRSPIKVLGEREVCKDGIAGRREYKARTKAMAKRQGWICCLFGHAPMCRGRLSDWDLTFDHEFGRGMGGGKRDDRIEIDGKWINGAAHEACNNWKGSRVIPYNQPHHILHEHGGRA